MKSFSKAWPILLGIVAQATASFGAPPSVDSGSSVPHWSVSWSAPDQVVVPMKIRHNLPTIPCFVNGEKVEMILDTGSQRCVLEAETARRAGVRPQTRIEVRGAHGKESAWIGLLENFSVGAWHWQNMPCVVLTPRTKSTASQWLKREAVAFNILGMDALQAMCSYVTIDYARCQVVFGFRTPFQPEDANGARPQSLVIRDGVPFVGVTQAGHTWSSLLDTGASSELEINETTAEQLGLNKQTRWVTALHFGLGVSDGVKRRRFECLVLPNPACLGRTWKNVETMLVDNESKIGGGLLKSSRLTLDVAGSRVWLEPWNARAR